MWAPVNFKCVCECQVLSCVTLSRISISDLVKIQKWPTYASVFTVICSGFFCSVADNDLSANTAIKLIIKFTGCKSNLEVIVLHSNNYRAQGTTTIAHLSSENADITCKVHLSPCC